MVSEYFRYISDDMEHKTKIFMRPLVFDISAIKLQNLENNYVQQQ